MLSLNRKTDYALVALAHLARQADAAAPATSARAIAEAYGLPRAMLANLLKQLHRAGLIDSARGTSGGYSLARPAGRITLAEVIAAIEERPVQVALCCQDGGADDEAGEECLACRIERLCPISGAIQALNADFAAILEGVTLQHLLDQTVHQAIAGAVDPQAHGAGESHNVLTSGAD
jgi:Rrf2 family protein